jgi:hypothetical protein
MQRTRSSVPQNSAISRSIQRFQTLNPKTIPSQTARRGRSCWPWRLRTRNGERQLRARRAGIGRVLRPRAAQAIGRYVPASLESAMGAIRPRTRGGAGLSRRRVGVVPRVRRRCPWRVERREFPRRPMLGPPRRHRCAGIRVRVLPASGLLNGFELSVRSALFVIFPIFPSTCISGGGSCSVPAPWRGAWVSVRSGLN